MDCSAAKAEEAAIAAKAMAVSARVVDFFMLNLLRRVSINLLLSGMTSPGFHALL
jgi:hypothetical protein